MTQYGQITNQQLRRLQTVYGQLRAHTLEGDTREGRLLWASEVTGRIISSFKMLTFEEARLLIDSAQGQLGVKAPAKQRLGRDQARRAGLDGRKDGSEYSSAPQIATAADLARIQRLLEELSKPPFNWNQDTFRAWLASPRSPLGKRSDKSIRTTADANKVWWALKRIAKAKGAWRKKA